MKLQVAGFLDNSMVNGEGLRSVLFVSGCRHNCDGCHNHAMQDYNYGEEIEIEDIIDRIKNNMQVARGVTFSGGEPFDKALELKALAKALKTLGINIWCYSGYLYEDIIKSTEKLELLKYIDVLVDGKFMKDLTEDSPKYAGSRNQRVLDAKKSLENNKIIKYL
ncbi:MAG: anaerobic ribonucleoside-triphosphate reductase activating protein [Clostridiaceae bacterium]